MIFTYMQLVLFLFVFITDSCTKYRKFLLNPDTKCSYLLESTKKITTCSYCLIPQSARVRRNKIFLIIQSINVFLCQNL